MMPRPRNSGLHDLFDKHNSGQMMCFNGKCNGKLLNRHSANLERHLRALHFEIYSVYIRQKTSRIVEKYKVKTKTVNQSAAVVQRTAKEVNRRHVEKAIVELFTRNGRPLAMLEDGAFKILVQPAFDALRLNVSESSVIERIIDFSQKLKAAVAEDLKGKLVSLKIDTVAGTNIQLLGVNVQYVKSQKICMQTLAIRQLEPSHTNEYLKSKILTVLNEYKIDMSQILTLTADNGDHIFQDSNSSIQNSPKEEPLSDEELLDNDSSTLDCFESTSNTLTWSNIESVPCGAHTLQLCVQDVLADGNIKEKIDCCRVVAQQLRSPNLANLFENGPHHHKPTIDSATKWTSTFDMLERLLENKEIIDLLGVENSALLITGDVWVFINDFLKAFAPLYIATMKLQSEQLYLSELYVILMDTLIQLQNLPSNEMSVALIDSLTKLKQNLFNNEVFNAAIFLDPRIKVCLDSDQIARAKKYVTSVHKRLVSLKETTSAIVVPEVKLQSNDEPSPSSLYPQTPKSFSELLQTLDPGPTNEPKPPSLTRLEADLLLYERQPRLPIELNILDFWSTQSRALRVVAEVILAVPSTQVSVERLLSSLDDIKSECYNKLPLFVVEHILLVKFNGEFKYDH